MEVGKFMMLGILTEDVDKSIDYFEMCGFHGWERGSFDSSNIPAFMIDGKPGVLTFEAATYRSETINIELLQPTCEGAFRDYLNEHGPGIHHIEFEPKADYETFMESARQKGFESTMEVDMLGGKVGFAYLNTEDVLGFRIEVHKD